MSRFAAFLLSDDESLLFVIAMAGWERASHIPALQCFSYEAVAKLPIDLNDFPLANDLLILEQFVRQALNDETHELCRQRVFRHEGRVRKGDMIRISALDPGVPLIEKLGNDRNIRFQIPSQYSDYQRIKEVELMTLGTVLIRDGKRPFESYIEKPRKPKSGSPDFSRFLDHYEYAYKELFTKAKKTLETLTHLSVEKQYKAISETYKEIDAHLLNRMLGSANLDRADYLSTPSYLAAEWAGLRCGLSAARPETEYPISYLMQVVTEQRAKKNKKQAYFVNNDKLNEVN